MPPLLPETSPHSRFIVNMCYQVDNPEHVIARDYEIIREDMEIRGGEPAEGAGPLPQFIEMNDPLADASEDIIDRRFAQDLEWLWPARQDRLADMEEPTGSKWLDGQVVGYFEAGISLEEGQSLQYSDYFLRRLLARLPKKMDYDSWVAKALIRHVAQKYNITPDSIHPSVDKKLLIWYPGGILPFFAVHEPLQLREHFDAITAFLVDLALDVSLWLPYEMQMTTSLDDGERVARYAQGDYLLHPTMLRPYHENGESGRFGLCWMHAKVVLGYDWFDIPFCPPVNW